MDFKEQSKGTDHFSFPLSSFSCVLMASSIGQPPRFAVWLQKRQADNREQKDSIVICYFSKSFLFLSLSSFCLFKCTSAKFLIAFQFEFSGTNCEQSVSYPNTSLGPAESQERLHLFPGISCTLPLYSFIHHLVQAQSAQCQDWDRTNYHQYCQPCLKRKV